MRKSTRYILAAALAYLLLLWLLVAVERAGGDALIDTLPKALWFSLATLTTVGYGDLYPVTAAGRLIGIVFMLFSTGLLALLIGLGYAYVTGRLYPRLWLRLRRKARWYVFAPDNAVARTIAARLDDGVVVFCGCAQDGRDGDALTLRASQEALFSLPFAGAGERVFFAVDDDFTANERAAAALRERDVRVYCRCEGSDGSATAFNEYECCARLYWQARPWKPEGERVALLGCGKYARALLNQGLVTAPPGCRFELFGDWDAWRGVHSALMALPMAETGLVFHDAAWPAECDSLRTADRVILCDDDRGVNLSALHALRKYCAIEGNVDALCASGLRDAYCFGDVNMLFTPDLVMKQTLNRLGRQLHELYRAQTGASVPPFEALSDFTQRSNFAAADHLLTKVRLLLPEEDARELTPGLCARAAARFDALSPAERERCRSIEHDRWVLFHALYNWRRAPERNDAKREHPLMAVPYEQLSEAERRKDDNPWLLLHALGNRDREV